MAAPTAFANENVDEIKVIAVTFSSLFSDKYSIVPK